MLHFPQKKNGGGQSFLAIMMFCIFLAGALFIVFYIYASRCVPIAWLPISTPGTFFLLVLSFSFSSSFPLTLKPPTAHMYLKRQIGPS